MNGKVKLQAPAGRPRPQPPRRFTSGTVRGRDSGGGQWRSVPSGSAPESDGETSGGFGLPGPDLRLIYVCSIRRVTREDLWRQMFLFPPTAVKTEQTEYLVFFLGMI